MKLKIKVHAGSSKEEIKKVSDSDGQVEVWIKETPVDGKANMKIEKMMKKYFGKPVKIKSGFTSRIKILEVEE